MFFENQETAIPRARGRGGAWQNAFRISRRHFLGLLGASAVLLLGKEFSASASPVTRPGLLVSEEEFARVKELITLNPVVQAWYAQAEQQADQLVEDVTAPIPWQCDIVEGECRSYNKTAAAIESALYILALMYRDTGLEKYADRAWQEMEAAAGLPDWNPQHFLDVAHMTSGMAVGYDWLYPALTERQRATIRRAIRDKGLKPGRAFYRSRVQWVKGRNNWNLVCNGAMALGALAVRESFPALAQEILNSAEASIRPALRTFNPDGGGLEGPGYWSSSVRYAVRYLASLDSVVGNDNRLSNILGLSDTGNFPIYLTGPTGLQFNFADAPAEQVGIPEMFWLSDRYDRPVYTWFNRRWGADGVESILYYRPDMDDQGPDSGKLPLGKRFRSSDVATMRSSWEDPSAIFAGLKAGGDEGHHSHLDLGSFVLDTLGQRWAEDLGPDNYALPGYFDVDGQRWTYYRIRAEGHNTLVIDPGSGPDQDPTAPAPFTSFKSGDDGAVAIVDLTQAYQPHVTGVRRGLKLFNGRRYVMVQDEIEAETPAEVWWFMHTRVPSIEGGDGGKEAILTGEDGNRLWARILSPSSRASFSVMPAEPLPTSPNPYPDLQMSRSDFRKLAIRLTDVTSERLAVLFVPLEPGQEPPQELPEIIPLDRWRAKPKARDRLR